MIEFGCNQSSSLQHIYEYFQLYFFTWFHGLMIIIGVVGSTLCFIVILRYRVFSNSTRYWFLSLTLSDLLMLILCGSDLYVFVLFPEQYIHILDKLGVMGCEFRMSVIVSLSWTSNILQTGLSIERMISILSPFKARIFFTLKRTRICLITLVLFCVISSFLINFLTLDYIPDISLPAGGKCAQRNITSVSSLDPTGIFYKIDLFMFRLLPYSIMLISSLLITGFVQQSRSMRKEMMQANIHPQATEKNREFRMSVLLLAMNFTTLLTNPLFMLFELFDGEASEGKAFGKLTGNHCISKTISTFFNSLLYVNNATNWCFYVAVGARFRSRFILLLNNCIHCRRTRASNRDNSMLDESTAIINGTAGNLKSSSYSPANCRRRPLNLSLVQVKGGDITCTTTLLHDSTETCL